MRGRIKEGVPLLNSSEPFASRYPLPETPLLPLATLYKTSWTVHGEESDLFPSVQVICTFLNALVRWVFQFPGTPYMSLKDRIHAQL
jgi:hypothetical protein